MREEGMRCVSAERILFLYLDYSPEILQLPLQPLSREEDAAFHRANGQVQLLGNLAILEAGDVHREGDAVFLGQGVHYAVHFLQVVGTFGAFGGCLARGAQVVMVLGGVHEGLFAHDTPVVVDKDIAHDGIYPALEVGARFVFVFVVQRLERSFLQQVVGVLTVGGEFEGEAQQFVLRVHQFLSKCHTVHNLSF